MAECYRKGDNYVYDTLGSDVPCSSSLPSGCCVSGDLCLADGICRYLHNGGGYYMQSCTDQTYSSSVCPPYCTNVAFPDVTYDATTGSWLCCGVAANGSGASCSAPTTNETFAAPAPQYLSTITSLASATSTSSALPASGTSHTIISFNISSIINHTATAGASTSSVVLPITSNTTSLTTSSAIPSTSSAMVASTTAVAATTSAVSTSSAHAPSATANAAASSSSDISFGAMMPAVACFIFLLRVVLKM